MNVIVDRFEKNHCQLKFSVPLPWQPNLIKTLATGVITKLMIQTRGPIPTYTLLNPVSLSWTWHFKHKFSITPTDYFVMMYTSCGKWLGLNIIQRLASRYSNKNFLLLCFMLTWCNNSTSSKFIHTSILL